MLVFSSKLGTLNRGPTGKFQGNSDTLKCTQNVAPRFIFFWREGPSSDQVLVIRIRLETRLVCRGLGCAHSEARVLASTMLDTQQVIRMCSLNE